MAGVGPRHAGRDILEGLLRPYAQVILSRHLGAGALVLAAIATFPRLAAATLLAVIVAQTVVLALGFGREAVRQGEYACAALLTALAATRGPDGTTWVLVVAGACIAVLFAAALHLLLSRYPLPALSLPFVASAWVVQLTARLAPMGDGAASASLALLPIGWFTPGWWDAPAALLYLHGAAGGVLLLAAIAVHSRISLLLAGIGALGAAALHLALRRGVDVGPLDLTATFNAMLTAMAVGGTFFVPHPSSIALGLFGGALAAVVTYALFPVSGVLGVPLLSLPFALTTLLIVAALRMRERDRHPVTALASATNPEDALERHLMRVRRFGDFAWLPFRLPFRGSWTVTQGHNGAHTHQGPWRHAFDFEVIGADGNAYETDGREPRDFRCYNLPVLAAGSGTVEEVRDGVGDNAVGGLNARENWGNTVVIAHGPNLYSVYSHLRSGSIPVKAGEVVRAGAEIGRCGNSGRSLVPHLHFHVQREAALGSDTLAADFGDVVERQPQGVRVSHRVLPAERAVVRPIVRDESVAGALAFAPGSHWRLIDGTTGAREDAQVETDLWGRRALRSLKGALFIESYENAMVAVAFDGDRDSLLRYVLLALARVPFDQEGIVSWTDRVPRRLLAGWGGAFLDLLSVVAPGYNDWDVTYRARRTEGTLTIEGAGGDFSSVAVVSLADRAHRITVTRDGAARTITLEPLNTAPAAQVAS